MSKRLRVVAVVTAFVLALPMQSLAQEVPPEVEEGVATAEALLAQIEAAAEEIADASGEDPVTIVDTILAQEIEVDVDGETVVVSFGELVNTVAGSTIIDRDNHGGIFGTPEIAAGNVLHISLDIVTDTWTGPLSAAPPVPQLGYQETTSEWSPDTPILPVLNPLFLAPIVGALVPDTDVDEVDEAVGDALDAVDEAVGDADVDLPPGANMPLLLTHMGGRLKHVTWELQGTGLGTHTVGAQILGNNADTAPRETDLENLDPWPIWLPIVTGDGFTTLPDTQVDFVGFGLVIQGATCIQLVSIFPNSSLPRVRVCTAAGTLIGDGVAEFDNALDFGTLLAPLWEEPPDEVKAVIEVVDEVIDALPLEDVLDLLGLEGELPDLDL